MRLVAWCIVQSYVQHPPNDVHSCLAYCSGQMHGLGLRFFAGQVPKNKKFAGSKRQAAVNGMDIELHDMGKGRTVISCRNV